MVVNGNGNGKVNARSDIDIGIGTAHMNFVLASANHNAALRVFGYGGLRTPRVHGQVLPSEILTLSLALALALGLAPAPNPSHSRALCLCRVLLVLARFWQRFRFRLLCMRRVVPYSLRRQRRRYPAGQRRGDAALLRSGCEELGLRGKERASAKGANQ